MKKIAAMLLLVLLAAGCAKHRAQTAKQSRCRRILQFALRGGGIIWSRKTAWTPRPANCRRVAG